jgi:hypothetical protein
MQATHVSHVGPKTYYVYNRTGSIRPISTRAFYYVKELKQDLLGGRALVKLKYRVILDKDPDISGIYYLSCYVRWISQSWKQFYICQ